jgi:ubiquinone/menaquinone biosynthesis C-methylase UbiE
MSHDAIRATFDGWVETGLADRLQDAHGDVVAQVLEQLAIRAGERILDLGCGNGWATRLLAQGAPGAQAVGVDASPRMIARADELHSFRIRARYELGRFEALEFPDGHFDRAFSMAALCFSPDVERALAELYRVLKPGGAVDVVLDCHAESPASARWGELFGIPLARRSAPEWRTAFEAAGFRSVATRTIVDRRGPGEPAEFTADEWCLSWDERVATHAAGSLWIHAERHAE